MGEFSWGESSRAPGSQLLSNKLHHTNTVGNTFSVPQNIPTMILTIAAAISDGQRSVEYSIISHISPQAEDQLRRQLQREDQEPAHTG